MLEVIQEELITLPDILIQLNEVITNVFLLELHLIQEGFEDLTRLLGKSARIVFALIYIVDPLGYSRQ